MTTVEPTWCETHQWATTGWPGTRGRRCALSQNDCVTTVRAGVKRRWDYERQLWVDVVTGEPWAAAGDTT